MLKRSNWRLIDDKDDLIKVARITDKYLQQTYKNDFGESENAILGLDLETFYTNPKLRGRMKRAPRPVWTGKYFEGQMRLCALGMADRDDFYIGDREYIIDLQAVTYKRFAACFKSLLEPAPILAQMAKYEYQYFYAMLDIDLQNVIDTMLTSQVFFAGDRIRHRLHDLYREFIPLRDFKRLTGMTHDDYAIFKKRNQVLDWAGDLTDENYQYSADDVRLLLKLFDYQCFAIDEFVEEWEQNATYGMNDTLREECEVMPIFAKMELAGMPFDKEQHYETIRFLEEKREEAQNELLRWPSFRKKINKHMPVLKYFRIKGSKWNVTEAAAEVRSKLRKNFPGAQGMSVSAKKHDAGDFIMVTWMEESLYERRKREKELKEDERLMKKGLPPKVRKPTKPKQHEFPTPKEVHRICKEVLDGHFEYFRERLVNLNYHLSVKDALEPIIGQRPTKTEEKVLRRYYDKKNKEHEAIDWLCRYKKAQGYLSKYGYNMIKHAGRVGIIRPSWNQIGRDTNEIVSGRSSCSGPSLMQIPSRETLFKYGDTPKGVKAIELFRTQFCAPPGYKVIDGDLSQIEPRMMCELTKDKNMIKLFRDGIDQHAWVAQQLLGLDHLPVEHEGVDENGKKYKYWLDEKDEWRRNVFGKTMNLAKQYRMGWRKLQEYASDRGLFLTEQEAKDYCDEYDDLFPGIEEHAEKVFRKAARRALKARSLAPFKQNGKKDRPVIGIARTRSGRTRRFGLLPYQESLTDEELREDYNPTDKWHYYNEFKKRMNKIKLAAHNHICQSECAAIFKQILIKLDKELKKEFGKDPKWNRFEYPIRAVVHDEILMIVPEEWAERAAKMLEDCMIAVASKTIKCVPVKANVKIGNNWAEAH